MLRVFTSFLHNFSFKRLINAFNEEFINCIARFHTLYIRENERAYSRENLYRPRLFCLFLFLKKKEIFQLFRSYLSNVLNYVQVQPFCKSTPLILLPGCLRLNYHPAVRDKILHFLYFDIRKERLINL